MSRRRQLEHEVSVAQERIKKAAKDTPKDILKLWEQELVDLELELKIIWWMMKKITMRINRRKAR